MQAKLILEGGEQFNGLASQHTSGTFCGEVVFTTGMTGYPETLTDPSYAGQIVTFTFPLIGNYGVPSSNSWESEKIYASGVILNELCTHHSHHTSLHSFEEWLHHQNIPLLTGVDTRALTKLLRSKGVQKGVITTEDKYVWKNSFSSVVEHVSCKRRQTYGNGKKKILAIDCGMKENILRELLKYDVTVDRVPYNTKFAEEEYDGLFLSNGPGDPQDCKETILQLKQAFKNKKPIFGICLGAQLMGLASGANTYKLKFGHRGHNQPCQDLKTGKCYLTSQNHGYAVDGTTLTQDWEISFKNLNDGSVEGISHKELPYFAVQFHPEAAPGPTDTHYLFEKFFQML